MGSSVSVGAAGEGNGAGVNQKGLPHRRSRHPHSAVWGSGEPGKVAGKEAGHLAGVSQPVSQDRSACLI